MREYLLTLIVAAAATYLATGVAGRLAFRVGAVPDVRSRDVHTVPVPRLGGVAMAVGLLSGMLVAAFLPRLSTVFDDTADARALLSAAVLICAVGVLDDILELDALTKLAGQILAAGVMVAQGLQLYWLPLPSGPLVLSQFMGALLTVAIVVVTVNAVNFVDGLDGLAAGIVGIGAAASFLYTYALSVNEGLSRMTTPALVAAVLTGMCLGFLPFNVHQARIFMGDSGSMLIGFLLAAASISFTARFDSQSVPDANVMVTLLPLLLPIAVLAIPVVDLLSAIWRRTRQGRSMFSADKEHLHHRMLALGHSHRRAVFLMWFWAFVLGFGVVAVTVFGGFAWAFLIGGALLAFALTVRGGATEVIDPDTASREELEAWKAVS